VLVTRQFASPHNFSPMRGNLFGCSSTPRGVNRTDRRAARATPTVRLRGDATETGRANTVSDAEA
jgi:hypothetical protein